MIFDKAKQIESMMKSRDKLLKVLAKNGISFEPDNGENNVIFKQGEKQITISHHSFYRFSGIVNVYKEGENKNEMIPVPVTDDMYYNQFMRPAIEALLAHA